MQLKLGLVSALVAAASASAIPARTSGLSDDGIVRINEYVDRNINEICFTTEPVEMCEEGYMVERTRNVVVPFHCLSKNNANVYEYKKAINERRIVPELKTLEYTIKGTVEVPATCLKQSQSEDNLNVQEQYLHGDRIYLHEKNEWNAENPREYTAWASTEEDNTVNKYDRNWNNDWNNNWNNNDWNRPLSYTTDVKEIYNRLKNSNIYEVLVLSDKDFDIFFKKLALVLTKSGIHNLKPEVETVLPTYFADVARDYYSSIKRTPETYDSTNYIKYKKLVKRIYSYIVKEALVYSHQNLRRYITTHELVHKVWEKVQKEMTKEELRKVENVVEHYYGNLKESYRMKDFTNELVAPHLQNTHESVSRNMMRLLITGLMRENHEYIRMNY